MLRTKIIPWLSSGYCLHEWPSEDR